jgi:cell wall assembly regulator SMI1
VTRPSADVERAWASYVEWLSEHASEAFAILAPGADDAALLDLERAIGQALPEALKALLRLNDGQLDATGCCALPGLEFLSTARIIQEWR